MVSAFLPLHSVFNPLSPSPSPKQKQFPRYNCSTVTTTSLRPLLSSFSSPPRSSSSFRFLHGFGVVACLPIPSTDAAAPSTSTKLYVSGLSFRTTEESLRNAFKNFGELIEVNLVMDKIAKRPRGFAFLRYATREESEKAIEGMHGKFLDGRVIFVEVAKPRTELRRGLNQNTRQN